MYCIINNELFCSAWMLITETCDVGPLGKLRPFLCFQHRRAALNLKKGKTYLIMGMAEDIYLDKKRQT